MGGICHVFFKEAPCVPCKRTHLLFLRWSETGFSLDFLIHQSGKKRGKHPGKPQEYQGQEALGKKGKSGQAGAGQQLSEQAGKGNSAAFFCLSSRYPGKQAPMADELPVKGTGNGVQQCECFSGK